MGDTLISLRRRRLQPLPSALLRGGVAAFLGARHDGHSFPSRTGILYATVVLEVISEAQESTSP